MCAAKKKYDEKMLKDYKDMWLIRKFEDKIYQLYSEGVLPGTIHASTGQEAVAVGICKQLRKDDLMFTNHRGHGHTLMKGAEAKKMFAELLGKETGYCKGLGGSMHVADTENGVLGANGVVGSGMPLAVGAALSLVYNGRREDNDKVCVVFFGDGASGAGVFHECMNMASNWNLPLIFVCENNLYGMSTPIKEQGSIENIADRAAGYNMEGVTIDGNDLELVKETAARLIKKAREGGGPSLLECKTYRYNGHSRGDKPYGIYRTKEEVDYWKTEKDPILRYEKVLGLSDEEIKEIKKETDALIDEAVKFAMESDALSPEEVLQYVFA